MRNHKRVVLLVFAVFTIIGVTALAALRSQDQDGLPPIAQTNVNESQYPIADYSMPEPTDPQRRERRHARGARFNLPTRNLNGVDLEQFVLSENRPLVRLGGPASNAPVEPAFPVTQSDVVVVGDVTSAQAHLSNDRTDIYSEFTVRVQQVLKNDSPLTVNISEILTTTRYGGRLRLPSGRLLLRGTMGRGMPRSGRRYALFLKYNEEGQDFSIVTGYEFRAGRVFPLDGLNVDGNVIRQWTAYQNHQDADVITFLSEIREAILNPSLHAPRRGAIR